jgi:uncharacterized coiled-coil DUF342 family protein
MPHFTRSGVQASIEHFDKLVKELETQPKTLSNKQKLSQAFKLKNHYKYILKRMGNNENVTLPNTVR